MVAHHGLHVGHSRHNSLGASAEPRKEMGLNESGHNANIGLHAVPVDPRRDAGSSRSEGDTGRVVKRFVVEHAPMGHDLGRE